MSKAPKPTIQELWMNPETREEARKIIAANIGESLEWHAPWARYQRLKQWHESLPDTSIKTEIYDCYVERVDANGEAVFGGTNALLHLAKFHIALMYADHHALCRKKAVGGLKGAATKRPEQEAMRAKITEHWERLEMSGMPERSRAAVIAGMVGLEVSGIRRHLRALKE